MDSSRLTPQQVAAFRSQVMRQLRYLGRARTRMERLGFPPDDLIYQETSRAYEAVHGLSVRLHYLACGMAGESAPKPVNLPVSGIIRRD